MKIHFGFPNPENINKLAPALQAQDINLLKAEPSKIALKGLHRIPQPGYSEYASHLPAFMYATETVKRTPLSREGYPVLTKVADILPLNIPPIYVSYKGLKDITNNIKTKTTVKPISTKDKNSKAYSIDYTPGIFGLIAQTDFDKNVFPIANTISAEDLGSLITIIRIISGFLRTNKYPAFSTNEEFEYEFSQAIEVGKRTLTDADSYTVDSEGKPLKKMAVIDVDGEKTWVKPELMMTEATVTLHFAKPTVDATTCWGPASSIPITDGIVFPYIEELAIWDKDTVCNVIGHYFTRCLGHTTDGCLRAYSELCQHWKRSLHRTPLGNVLSHLFKVVELAIPSQSRPYPVIEAKRYTGCYLSGSGYSIALRSELFRPTTYENNISDFDCFDGMDALLMKILSVVTTDNKKKENMDKIKKMASVSMRGLGRYLTTWIISTDKWDKIRTIAARLKYPQEYLRINIENIQLALSYLQDGKDPELDFPMHAYGLGRTTRIESILSAFGPTAPSPNIPGSQRIAVTPKAPANFNKVLAFRTTTLENAIADWNEFADKGFVYNGPERLSARYQFVQVRGEEDRDKWFSVLNAYHVWFKEAQKAGLSGDVVETDVDQDDFDFVTGGAGGVDLSGF